ncbi:MAG: hypothetical protein QM733_18930 [Ilumatobacteraceae bacterium]
MATTDTKAAAAAAKLGWKLERNADGYRMIIAATGTIVAGVWTATDGYGLTLDEIRAILDGTYPANTGQVDRQPAPTPDVQPADGRARARRLDRADRRGERGRHAAGAALHRLTRSFGLGAAAPTAQGGRRRTPLGT